MTSWILVPGCFWFGLGVVAQATPPPSATFPSQISQPAGAPAAESAAPCAAPPAADGAPPANAELWRADYTRARQQLEQREFGAAAARFRELAARAPSPGERSRALELAEIAAALSAREKWAELPGETQAKPASDSAPGLRSSDEIAALYLNAVLYGLGTGVFLGVHTEPSTPAGAILPSLALAGGLGGAVAAVDRGDTLRYGVPQAIVSGMYLGLGEGVAWAIWNQARARYYEQWSNQTVATVIWGSATAGAIAGAAIGASTSTTPGRASYVGTTGLWGGAIAGLVGGATGSDDEYLDDRVLLGAALGLNAGAIAGVLTAKSVSPSIARVRFLDLGGIAGGVLVGGLYASAEEDIEDVRGLFAATAVGVGAGIGVAALLTAKMPKDLGTDTESAGSIESTRFALIPLDRGAAVGVSGAL